jgi:DNA repair protein RecO (recombination protein O)
MSNLNSNHSSVHNLSSKGIILKKTKFSEADLILQVILNNGEKLSLIAKGALRSKKRFSGGVLEPSHFVKLEYKQSSQAQLATLLEATLLDDFSHIRTDYDRMECALFCVQIINKVSQEGDVFAEGLFNLLGNILKKIASPGSAFQSSQYKAIFILKLLFQQGVLETEDWMRPILARPLSDIQQIKLSDAQITWCLSKIESYLD